MSIKSFSFFAFLILLASCSSVQKRDDSHSLKKKFKTENINSFRIKNEIASIDAQISNLEGMIISVNARIQSYQLMNTPGQEGVIAGAKMERSSYENQKQLLEIQKRQKLLTLSSEN